MSSGFIDLCVNPTNNDPNSVRAVLQKLYQLGFRTVAINSTFDDNALEVDKKRKKKDEKQAASNIGTNFEPLNIDDLIEEYQGKMQILSKVTIVCSDPGKLHILSRSVKPQRFNLYSIAPTTQNALQFVCSQAPADVIAIRPSATGLKLNKKLYDQAVERGLHFEIQYSDLLDPETRKFAIHYAHLFHTYGRSKNVILTSGASEARMTRSPYDLINLCFLLGLNEVKAKASILQQCRTLLLKAERRRRGKAVFAIKDARSTSEYINSPSTPLPKRIKH